MTATLPGSIEAQISGENRGQIAVGNHIIQNNVDHGGIVYIAAAGETPTPRLRQLPISLPGRRPPDPLGRDKEIQTALEAVNATSCLEFVGPSGIGKTTLLKHVAYRSPSEAAPHGVVYHRAHGEAVGDTLQHLFEAFYETSVPFKPTDAEIQHAMRDVEALIVIDDVETGRDGVDVLRDALPSAAFLLASAERSLWGGGRSVPLRGLKPEAALELLELELGQPISEDERPMALNLLKAGGGQPLKVMHLATLIAELGYELSDLASDVREGSAPAELGQLVVDSLDENQRKIWEVLAALDGATLPADQLAELTGVKEPQPVIDSLLALGLLQAHSPRYSVTAPAEDLSIELAASVGAWAPAARDHFIRWAEANKDQPDVVLQEAEAVLAVLRAAARDQAWSDLIRLGRAVEGPFIIGRRWAAWREVLDQELIGARSMGDKAAEGWALHQLGTRALCMDDRAEAREALTEALDIREELGDEPGAAVTRHNLDLLLIVADHRKRAAAVPEAAAPIIASSAPLLGLPFIFLLGVAALVAVGGGAFIIKEASPDPVVPFQPVVAGLTVEPARLDFGNQRTGTSSEQRQVTVMNDSAGPFLLGTISITGPGANAYRFDLAQCTGAELGSGARCTVSVVFAPQTAGPHEATLAIPVADDGQQAVALFGRGTGDDLVGPPVTPSALRLDPASLNFGRHPINGPPVVQRISVTNTTTSAIDFSGLRIDGVADFQFVNGRCATRLDPGATCTADVRFVAGDVGGRSATLLATSATDVITSVPLSGEGAAGPNPPVPTFVEVSFVGESTVAYGRTPNLLVTARTNGDPAALVLDASSGLPEGTSFVKEADGRWRLQGVVTAAPSTTPHSITARVSLPGAQGMAPFSLTVVRAEVTIRWLQPVVDLTLGSPVAAKAVVTQAAGTSGDLRNAQVYFELQDVLSSAIYLRPPVPVAADGSAILQFQPTELPLGTYIARALIDPTGGYYRMAPPVPVSVVVNSDVLSASVNVLSDILATLGFGQATP